MAVTMNDVDVLPNGNIGSVEDIGMLIRAYRKNQSASQAEFAALCGVGIRFISDLENGKPTIELGKALHVLKSLGLEIQIHARNWQASANKSSSADKK